MKYRKNLTVLWIIAVLLIIASVVALTIGNITYARNNPGGNDFMVHWLGTRKLVKDGSSPYSDETANAIQKFAYGRPAQPGEHELRVAYPLYSIVLFFPFSLIRDYPVARGIWMTLLEAALLGLGFISIRLTRWKPNFLVLGVFGLFSLFWYHAFRPLINGNAVILVALFITAAILCLREGADELAGVLLAFSTIKPQLVILLLVFIVYWGIKQRRWRLITWLFVTLGLLVASTILLIPDWIIQNIREVVRYTSYNPPGTLTAALTEIFPGIGDRMGWTITAILAIILLVEWYFGVSKDFRSFLWAACITLIVSQWIGIQTDPGNFIILYLPLVLVFAIWEERWRRMGQMIAIVSMLILLVGLWGLFLITLEPGYQPQQSPVMFIPVPLFLLITMYWVRWWAVSAPHAWFDEINTH